MYSFKKSLQQTFFNELCVKISLLRSINKNKKKKKIKAVCNAVYYRLCTFFHQLQPELAIVLRNHGMNRDNVGIVLRKEGIPTLSANSGIVPDNSRIAEGIHVVLWSDMVSAQNRNRRGQSKNLKGRIR